MRSVCSIFTYSMHSIADIGIRFQNCSSACNRTESFNQLGVRRNLFQINVSTSYSQIDTLQEHIVLEHLPLLTLKL